MEKYDILAQKAITTQEGRMYSRNSHILGDFAQEVSPEPQNPVLESGTVKNSETIQPTINQPIGEKE
ncbi:MAG: hypothetical protein ACRC2T_18450 [Thermoguttaceae bacterium]